MNWYRNQLNKEAKGMWTAFGWLTIPAIAVLLGGSVIDIAKKIKENPQQLAQEIKTVQQNTDPNTIQNLNIPQDSNVIPEPMFPAEPNVVPEPQGAVNIDLNKIHQIESEGGKLLWNKETGARGHFQFVRKTWDEMMGRMGKNWDWWNDSMDYEKSKQVADFYYNKRIPAMLNYYKIPDTIKTRIGAYNWGIGELKKKWTEYGQNWLLYAPKETQEYVQKYG